MNYSTAEIRNTIKKQFHYLCFALKDKEIESCILPEEERAKRTQSLYDDHNLGSSYYTDLEKLSKLNDEQVLTDLSTTALRAVYGKLPIQWEDNPQRMKQDILFYIHNTAPVENAYCPEQIKIEVLFRAFEEEKTIYSLNYYNVVGRYTYDDLIAEAERVEATGEWLNRGLVGYTAKQLRDMAETVWKSVKKIVKYKLANDRKENSMNLTGANLYEAYTNKNEQKYVVLKREVKEEIGDDFILAYDSDCPRSKKDIGTAKIHREKDTGNVSVVGFYETEKEAKDRVSESISFRVQEIDEEISRLQEEKQMLLSIEVPTISVEEYMENPSVLEEKMLSDPIYYKDYVIYKTEHYGIKSNDYIIQKHNKTLDHVSTLKEAFAYIDRDIDLSLLADSQKLTVVQSCNLDMLIAEVESRSKGLDFSSMQTEKTKKPLFKEAKMLYYIPETEFGQLSADELYQKVRNGYFDMEPNTLQAIKDKLTEVGIPQDMNVIPYIDVKLDLYEVANDTTLSEEQTAVGNTVLSAKKQLLENTIERRMNNTNYSAEYATSANGVVYNYDFHLAQDNTIRVVFSARDFANETEGATAWEYATVDDFIAETPKEFERKSNSAYYYMMHEVEEEAER